MSDPSEILQQRLSDVAGVTLADMLRRSPRLTSVSAALAATFRTWSPKHGDVVETWSDTLTRGMTRFLTSEYQYLDITGAAEPLQSLYRRFLSDLWLAARTGADPTFALQAHHERLRSWLAERVADTQATELVLSGFRPVCAAYDPTTQLAVLGLDVDEMISPVLDIGCGDGRLVEHLRAAGMQAVGIDRNASKGFLCGDWFDAPLDPGRWGTIVAHQSVSLHFVHAHRHSSARAANYASLFVRTLGALKAGGSFVYAPAVPFFDPLLRHHGLVTHHHMLPGVSSTRVTV